MRNAVPVACLTFAIAFAGCSARDQPPDTPDIRAATPTNRGTVNSWELAMGRINVSPGSNSGLPLPIVPRARLQEGFEPSDPTAVAVYTALVNKKIETQFIATAGKDGTVLLEGTVSDDKEKAAATQIATGVSGVKKVVNELKISKDPPSA